MIRLKNAKQIDGIRRSCRMLSAMFKELEGLVKPGVETLELDMDMEADLGIDSIKRVEILGALQAQFPDLPKVEDKIGKPLSPYAVTKYVNELYADVFARTYGFQTIGLRYFNIFGRRQDPNGAYAAVMPKWFSALIRGEKLFINGDGETSRDFCYIDNCVQGNLLAATTTNSAALNQVYNIAFGERTTLNQLFSFIQQRVHTFLPEIKAITPTYRDFRPGDVRHSLADISKARTLLGYEPIHSVKDGLDQAAEWYVRRLSGE